MSNAIHQIAAELLAELKTPMTADEIYELIKARGLCEFKAKCPKSVLRCQLRRHSAQAKGAHQASKAIFNMSPDVQFTLV